MEITRINTLCIFALVFSKTLILYCSILEYIEVLIL